MLKVNPHAGDEVLVIAGELKGLKGTVIRTIGYKHAWVEFTTNEDEKATQILSFTSLKRL